MATGIADITACDDAAECKAVENIITIITHYHYWNEEQIKKNPEHSSIDYSALYNDNNNNNNNDEYDDNGLTSLSSLSSLTTQQAQSPTNRTIHPQLTKNSASIKKISKYENIISEFMDDANYSDINLLNDFDHCLEKHCNDDREFEFIYLELTKENEIKIKINKSNNILHRHNYSRDILYSDIELIKKLYYGYYESNEIHHFEILDKIYIHFLFSYKFGFRLEPQQILQIESAEEQRLKLEEKSEKDPEINIDKTLGTITEKLTFLRMNLTKFDTFKNRFNKSNRYVTNYNNAMLLNSEFNQNIEIKLNIDNDNNDQYQDDSKSVTKKSNTEQEQHDDDDIGIKVEMESLQQLATVQGIIIYHPSLHIFVYI